MDAFIKKIERLATLAQGCPVPGPLDQGGLMARIRGLERDNLNTIALPLGFFAGGAAVAAVAAVAISLLAVTAWSDMSSPFAAMDSLLNIMDVL